MLRMVSSDRRHALRLFTQIPVTANFKGEKKTFIASDINSSGMYFECDCLLVLNSEIEVSFKLPRGGTEISAIIKVVRIEVKEKEGFFGAGALFIKLDDKDKESVEKLLERLDVNKLLEIAIKRGASDLHLLAMQSPVLRVNSVLEALDLPPFEPQDIQDLLYSVMSRQQIRRYEETRELDFVIQYDLENRFRVNLHQQRGFTEAVLRLINRKVSSFEELNIPEVVKDLVRLKDGLIVISGSTGSGKTTTMAAMVELINQEKKAVIITLERPIEYIYINKKSIIKQREIGVDTPSFAEALKSSLRQDPNIIVVGEVDDLETIKTALVAAEAGYLVIISMHAPNTLQTVDRICGFFPSENRKQHLSQLANCLRGIVTQVLIPSRDQQKRILATEILIGNDAAKRIIRSDQLIQLPTIIQTGASAKMQTMSESIKRLVDSGSVDSETANYFSEESSRYAK